MTPTALSSIASCYKKGRWRRNPHTSSKNSVKDSVVGGHALLPLESALRATDGQRYMKLGNVNITLLP